MIGIEAHELVDAARVHGGGENDRIGHPAIVPRFSGRPQDFQVLLSEAGSNVNRRRYPPALQSLQDRWAPENRCFGCGPANEKGLRIKSFVRGDEVVCEWRPEPHHAAFDGVLNGGICGALLDCHSNWCAAMHLMRKKGESSPPFTVTADFAVKLKRPTPIAGPITLRAKVVESQEDRAVVEAELEAGGKVTATCRGTFVTVKPGHPAYHRW
jgi:acyl-coenzyme A thioesterase PaaI-like protein